MESRSCASLIGFQPEEALRFQCSRGSGKTQSSHLPGRLMKPSLGRLAVRRRRMPRVNVCDLLGKSQARQGRSSALQPCLQHSASLKLSRSPSSSRIFTSRNPSVVNHCADLRHLIFADALCYPLSLLRVPCPPSPLPSYRSCLVPCEGRRQRAVSTEMP